MLILLIYAMEKNLYKVKFSQIIRSTQVTLIVVNYIMRKWHTWGSNNVALNLRFSMGEESWSI